MASNTSCRYASLREAIYKHIINIIHITIHTNHPAISDIRPPHLAFPWSRLRIFPAPALG